VDDLVLIAEEEAEVAEKDKEIEWIRHRKQKYSTSIVTFTKGTTVRSHESDKPNPRGPASQRYYLYKTWPNKYPEIMNDPNKYFSFNVG